MDAKESLHREQQRRMQQISEGRNPVRRLSAKAETVSEQGKGDSNLVGRRREKVFNLTLQVSTLYTRN